MIYASELSSLDLNLSMYQFSLGQSSLFAEYTNEINLPFMLVYHFKMSLRRSGFWMLYQPPATRITSSDKNRLFFRKKAYLVVKKKLKLR
jgi:hypothetical protein